MCLIQAVSFFFLHGLTFIIQGPFDTTFVKWYNINLKSPTFVVLQCCLTLQWMLVKVLMVAVGCSLLFGHSLNKLLTVFFHFFRFCNPRIFIALLCHMYLVVYKLIFMLVLCKYLKKNISSELFKFENYSHPIGNYCLDSFFKVVT